MTNLCLLAGGIAGWWASIEDAMAEAAVNTVIGISVVFAALLLFVFVAAENLISLQLWMRKFEVQKSLMMSLRLHY